MKKLTLTLIIITILSCVSYAGSVPFNYAYLLADNVHRPIFLSFASADELIEKNNLLFLADFTAFKGNEISAYDNYIGPTSAFIFWEPLKNREYKGGIFFSPVYLRADAGKPGYITESRQYLIGVRAGNQVFRGALGWILDENSDDAGFVHANFYGFDLMASVNFSGNLTDLNFIKLFETGRAGRIGPVISYYGFYDTLKAGVIWDRIMPADFIELSAEGMADVYNRGLGAGMSYISAAALFKFENDLALKIAGSYSEEYFYEGLWGGQVQIAVFNNFFIAASYNYNDSIVMNPLRNQLFLSVRVSASIAYEKQGTAVSPAESVIKDNLSDKTIGVESFIFDQNLKTKDAMRSHLKNGFVSTASVITAAAAGGLVLILGTPQDASYAAVGGALLGYWLSPSLFEIVY
ncbi:MAG: hypothetical protein JXR81_08785 [Candidatus Goldbacteria bacterium]|nr:hypothetical protein [Candidatus Goldiibacteriota bacterium]